MPLRAALEADDPTSVRGYDRRSDERLALSLGIPTLDPWEHFRPLVQRDGSSRYFIGDHDIHMSREGHIEMADWLVATSM
jgi:hypothetical protein